MDTITRTVRVANGPTFQVCLNPADRDGISAALAAGEYALAWQWQLFGGFLTPGAVVVDLGVHVGSFSLPAVAAGCRVLSVEASPRNIALLRASRAANGFEQWALIHAAVSDRPGELPFVQDGPFGHVYSPLVGARDVVRVPALPLDDILAANGFDRVDFVKMDVEGAEVAAVAGMTGLLARPDAPAFYYESNSHTLNLFAETPGRLKGLFERAGYANHHIDYDARRLVPVAAGDPQPECCTDYLALKAGRPLPAALAGWTVAAPFTRGEWLEKFRTSTHAADIAPHRDHFLREFAAAADWVRADAGVAGLAAELRPVARAA